VEAHECPACGMRFRHPRPNACTACRRVHCRNCLKVFRDEMEEDIEVRFQKRAHNPLILASGLADEQIPVPWLGGRRLRLVLG